MRWVILYYYYPEKLKGAPRWVRQLAEVLVACEQFEAYNNRRRGRDYYTRSREDLRDAFAYLEKLQTERILDSAVVTTIKSLVTEGAFDRLLAQARGVSLSKRERVYLKAVKKELACP
jgi:hypothetical protein